MKNTILLLLSFFFLISCSGFKEAGKVLRNEKTNTTDEFLVKKREPLVLPPNYEEILEPGTLLKKKDEEENLQKILKVAEPENIKRNKPSSIEDSILNRIRK